MIAGTVEVAEEDIMYVYSLATQEVLKYVTGAKPLVRMIS